MLEYNAPGYYAVMSEVKADRDPTAPWGSNVAWMFAIADYMWYWCGEKVPGYSPAPHWSMKDDANITYELNVLLDLIEEWEDADMLKVYNTLYRYDTWLRMAGKNY